MSQQNYVSHLDGKTYLKHPEEIREMIRFLNEDNWFGEKEKLKAHYKNAKKIADGIQKTHTLKSIFKYKEGTMTEVNIKDPSIDIKPKIYENCLMKAVCEIMLLAWLLCLDGESEQPETFENNRECENDQDFWPLYNKYSLKMCYTDLHSYVRFSTNLLNMERASDPINIGDKDLINKKNKKYFPNNNQSGTLVTNLIEPSNVDSSNKEFTRLRNDICHGEFSNLKKDNFFLRSKNDVQFSAFILKKYFLWEIEKTFPEEPKVINTPVARSSSSGKTYSSLFK